MIVSSFIIQANVITIINYDRHLFIVQATGINFDVFFVVVKNDIVLDQLTRLSWSNVLNMVYDEATSFH